ncbi:hypothetical protein RSOL_269500, partial [Rhizoctonia solani AG-3 Rhs1AP]
MFDLTTAESTDRQPTAELHKPEPMMSRVQSSIRKELKLKTKGKGRERPEEKEEIEYADLEVPDYWEEAEWGD